MVHTVQPITGTASPCNTIGIAMDIASTDLSTSFERVQVFGNERDRDFSGATPPPNAPGLISAVETYGNIADD